MEGVINASSIAKNVTIRPNRFYPNVSLVFALQILGYSLIFVLSIFGNALICIVILRKKIPYNFTNWNIFNLAVADILITLTIPFVAYEQLTSKFIFGQFLCKTIYSMRNIAVYTSCIVLVCISFNRFRAVTLIKQRQTVYKYTALIAFLAWIIGIIATLPQMFVLVIPINKTACQEQWQDDSLKLIYGFFLLIVFFLIPLAIICWCHAMIAWRLWHKAQSLNDRGKVIHQKKKKIVWMLAIVIVAFFLCHLPPNIIIMLLDIKAILWNPDTSVVLSVTFWLGYSHSIWNPIIYGALNKSMRDAILGTVFEVKKASTSYAFV